MAIWRMIEEKLASDKEPYIALNAIYEVQLSDVDDGIYQLEFQGGKAIIYYRSEKEPDCTLKLKTKYFQQFLHGNFNSATAFMTGKLKITGDIGLALKLENMLNKYNLTS